MTIGSFFINYATENANFTDSQASNLLSYALITFTVGRFVGVVLAHFFQADFILLVYSVINIVLSAYTSAAHGQSGVIVLIVVFFFESVMFPTIFVMGAVGLGRHTSRGAGILMMGVSGGAVFPPIQGAIADAHSTRISFLVPMVGFMFVLAYTIFHWIKHGLKIRRINPTVDVHVVTTPGQKRASMIISQETVDAIIDNHRKSSHPSSPTDITRRDSKRSNQQHPTGITNQTFVTSEYL